MPSPFYISLMNSTALSARPPILTPIVSPHHSNAKASCTCAHLKSCISRYFYQENRNYVLQKTVVMVLAIFPWKSF